MDLSIYNVIQGPVVSDKAYKLNKEENKLVLKVHPMANKSMIKEALEKLFDVKVDKVHVLIRQGKNKRVRNLTVTGKKQKKAIVTLAEGYSLDLIDQSGVKIPTEAKIER